MISAEEARERTFLYQPSEEVDNIAHHILEELSERVLEQANKGEFETDFRKDIRLPKEIVSLGKGDVNYISEKVKNVLKTQGYKVFWCMCGELKRKDEIIGIVVDISISWDKNEE